MPHPEGPTTHTSSLASTKKVRRSSRCEMAVFRRTRLSVEEAEPLGERGQLLALLVEVGGGGGHDDLQAAFVGTERTARK